LNFVEENEDEFDREKSNLRQRKKINWFK